MSYKKTGKLEDMTAEEAMRILSYAYEHPNGKKYSADEIRQALITEVVRVP